MLPNSKLPVSITKPSSVNQFARLGIGGAAGSGKTHLMGTVAPNTKVLVIDLEGGSETYMSAGFAEDPNAVNPDNIDVVNLRSLLDDKGSVNSQIIMKSVLDVFLYLNSTKNSDGYGLVVLDSISELQNLFISNHPATDPRQAYGDLSSNLYTLSNYIRQTPAHVAALSGLRFEMDKTLGSEVVRMHLSPAAWSSIGHSFSAIGYMTAEKKGPNIQRVLEFSLSTRYQTKDRYGFGKLVNPTMQDILEKVENPEQRESSATPAKVVRTKPTPVSRGARTASPKKS